ncbi:MAG: deoxyguanosinetriphosphate triphosphohydrolase family protein [Coriobacteriales bacterium]|jgi:dGTPase
MTTRGTEHFTHLDDDQVAYVHDSLSGRESLLSEFACQDGDAVYENGVSPEEMESSDGELYYVRPPFVADVDRIINNPFFTRASGKTQVFSLYRNDNITRRGFHIQLVSQTAMKIAAALRLNISLVQAIGLGHDMGHTPFGHAGEHFLNDIYNARTGRYFNHNVHSVRALRNVAPCNLSLQTYNGMLCHCGENNFATYTTSPCPTFNDLDALMEECYTQKGRSSLLRPSTLEGCVVRICDIIAYLGKDRQDAVETGLITKEEYFLDSFLGTNNSQIIRNVSMNIIKNSIGRDRICMDEEVSDEIRRLKRGNFETIYNYDSADKVLSRFVKPMMEQLYEKFIDDLAAGNESSPVFTDHAHAWFIENRNPDYPNLPPNEIVTDYIASMSDDYFIAVFRHLFPDDPKAQLDLYHPYFG